MYTVLPYMFDHVTVRLLQSHTLKILFILYSILYTLFTDLDRTASTHSATLTAIF